MRREIAVIGAGLSGFSAALAFAERGFDTVLLAPAAPADARSTALIGESVAFLESIGVWPLLEPDAQPLAAMRIVDDTGRLARAPSVEFRASEIGRASFGSNVLNARLHAALREVAGHLSARLEIVEEALEDLQVEGEDAVLRAAGGRTFRVSLVVGADGRQSVVRRSAGIEMRSWTYPQSAIVLNFSHAQDHGATSTEFHRATGPFTQVPLPGRRSSLVWVKEPEIAALVPDLKREALSRMVEDRLHSILGAVEVEDGMQVFPISGGNAAALTGPRVALVGEAAHVFPPIGAQGLNLGLRDAAAIVEAAARRRDDPGAPEVLARYEAARRGDVASRSTGVDLLNRSLLTGFAGAQIGRAAGLGALSAIAPLRRFAMREGLSPGSGLRHILSLPFGSDRGRRPSGQGGG